MRLSDAVQAQALALLSRDSHSVVRAKVHTESQAASLQIAEDAMLRSIQRQAD